MKSKRKNAYTGCEQSIERGVNGLGRHGQRIFSARKKSARSTKALNCRKTHDLAILHLFLQREASTKKRLWTGASLRQTATEPLETTEKFRASSKNFGSRRRAFSGTMRHWPRWPKGPQMTAFLPRQDSPPGLWLQRSRAWLACWGLCRRLVQRSVRSQPIPTS